MGPVVFVKLTPMFPLLHSKVCSITTVGASFLKKETKLKVQELRRGSSSGGAASIASTASTASTLCKAVIDVSEICQQLQSQQLLHQQQQQPGMDVEGGAVHTQLPQTGKGISRKPSSCSQITATLTEAEGRYSIPLM